MRGHARPRDRRLGVAALRARRRCCSPGPALSLVFAAPLALLAARLRDRRRHLRPPVSSTGQRTALLSLGLSLASWSSAPRPQLRARRHPWHLLGDPAGLVIVLAACRRGRCGAEAGRPALPCAAPRAAPQPLVARRCWAARRVVAALVLASADPAGQARRRLHRALDVPERRADGGAEVGVGSEEQHAALLRPAHAARRRAADACAASPCEPGEEHRRAVGLDAVPPSATAPVPVAARLLARDRPDVYRRVYSLDPARRGAASEPRWSELAVDIVINNHNYDAFLGGGDRERPSRRPTSGSTWSSSTTARPTARASCSREYADRVEVVLKENGGQASALNAGFEHCRGDVVIFLDADDVLHPEAAARVAAAFAADGALAKVQFRMDDDRRRGRLDRGDQARRPTCRCRAATCAPPSSPSPST